MLKINVFFKKKVAMKNRTNPLREYGLSGLIIYITVMLIVFIVETLVGKLPENILIPFLISVSVVSIASVFLGYFAFRNLFGVNEKAILLQEGFEALQKSRALLVSNEAISHYEKNAVKVRIITPTLYNDLNDIYETVLQNVRANVTYEYVTPGSLKLLGKFKLLQTRLSKDSGVNSLPIKHSSFSGFPILTEYMIYQEEDGSLKGFMEIRIGTEESDTTNMPLSDDEAHFLNGWFDKMFSQSK